MPDERGFTLLELVVVLAILGLAVALTVPFVATTTPRAQLGAAAGALRIALRNARGTAIAEGRAVAFRGDPAGGYWLGRAHHRLAGFGPVRVSTQGAARIDFLPSGGSSGGRVVVVGAAARRIIEVDAVTGRAVLLP